MLSISSEDCVYTETEHATWRRFFLEIEAIWARHGDLIHPYYLDHVDVLRPFSERIPALSEINAVLRAIGWTAVYVDGLAPPWEIARLIDRKVMPVSRQIRPPEEVFFANGPDLIHDMFGHLPSLFSADYRKLLARWSYTASRLEIAEIDKANYHLNKLIVQSQDRVAQQTLSHLLQAAHGIDEFVATHPSPSLMFDKAYFWIFEFGLVQNGAQVKILGAGLLSSMSEIVKIASHQVEARPLNLRTILSPYNISTHQEGYVMADSMQSYDEVMGAMIARFPVPAATLPKAYLERTYAHA